MKKLMMSLLAVLLGIGFCWAETMTVSGKVQYVLPNESTPVSFAFGGNPTVTFTAGEETLTANVTESDGSFTITGATIGTLYTVTFRGNIQSYNNITFEDSFTPQTGREYTMIIPPSAFTTGGGGDEPDPTPTTETLTVKVAYAPEGFESSTYSPSWITGAKVICKEKNSDEKGTEETTATDYSQQIYNPQATFTIDPTKDYTISVTADGYKAKTTEWAANTASKTVNIAMDRVTVTVQGTVTLGSTQLTALPEGITLKLKPASDNATPITVTADGYKLENIWVGENGKTYITVDPSKIYSITTPENGEFTLADNDNHTVTQNIVITKTAANVYVKTNPDDNIYPSEVMLAQGEKTFTASNRTEDYKIVFEGIEAGTYTVQLNRFGYKLQGTAPTVTVGADCEDQTVETIAIVAGDETVSISGVAKYTNKVDNTPVYLNGAVAKLYATKRTENGYEKDGEALETKTTGEDGVFSFEQTIAEPTYFIVTLTHDAILPFEDDVYVRQAENTVSFSPKVIWISGSITNAADLAGDLKFKWTTENGNEYVYAKPETWDGYTTLYSDLQNAKYYAYATDAAPIAGTYKLQLSGQDDNGFLMEANETVTITDKAVTKDLTAAKNENKGYMTIRLRYTNPAGAILPVANAYMYIYEDETYINYVETDGNGNAKYLTAKDKTYKLVSNGLASLGYLDTTVNNVPAFITNSQGTELPNDLTIYTRGKEATLITYSGTIDASAWPNMPTDVKIGLQTQRDKQLMYANIVEGQYTFENVPVVMNGNMEVFLVQPDAKLSEYGVTVPYNYSINPGTIYAQTTQTSPVTTNNFTIRRTGCNVSGSVSPAASGEASLTEAGATRATHSASIMGGAYKFQGVAAGQYTVTIKCTGYETYTTEFTVAAALNDTNIPAATLTAKAETILVSGRLSAYNKATLEDFDGAKLEIWNGANTEKLAETTIPENSYGYIPSGFTFTATMGTEVIFKMTHPSIQPVSKKYTVNNTTLTIAPTDLGYVFVAEGADFVVPTDFKAEWNADKKLALSWGWPADAADATIRKVVLRRKLTSESGNGSQLIYWTPAGATFTAAELPVAYTDTVTQALDYTYVFEIIYLSELKDQTPSYRADMRDGTKYTLAYTVNDDKMGTLTSYQPAGEYMENDMITLTAKAKEGYKFVKFQKNDKDLAESETITLIGDTAATYGFKMPAENVIIKAFFALEKEYTVTLKSSNEAWGTVSGEGTFETYSNITVKAVVKDADKYEFVAWMDGETEKSKDAEYTFTVENDITLTAVFKEKPANEKLESAKWSIFAENGAIVIKGLDGDRYDIFDLNGRLAGQALGTGAEIRISVTPSRLYIVRRLGADGSFDAKKIVVR